MEQTTGGPVRDDASGDAAAEAAGGVAGDAEGIGAGEAGGTPVTGPGRQVPPALFETAEELIAYANLLCLALGRETLSAVARLQAGDFGDLPRAGGIVRELLSVSKAVWDEGVKREKQRQQGEGGAEDYALDLERARAEISGRLARIAAADGDQGASG
jgi:hypothetical protein